LLAIYQSNHLRVCPKKAFSKFLLENIMPNNHIHLTGEHPDQDTLLADISYIQEIFFDRETPKHQPIIQTPNKTEDQVEPSRSSKKEKSSKTQVINKEKSFDKPEMEQTSNQFPKAQQIFLRKVGDCINIQFIDSGSRMIKKANRECFVIYLQDSDGTLLFLQGTQLQEELDAKNLTKGDRIKIEKTGQYKRAAERSHARPAVFEITKL
jgi:hypothetical protein